MDTVVNYISEWSNLLNINQEKCRKYFLTNKDLAKEYEGNKKNVFDIGYNIFTLSSDFYFRENFHSDIIKSLLCPFEKHDEKNKYLFLFIDLLNKINNKNLISKSDFENSNVVREKGNIDILITNLESKKAIIIENKINNAIDQPRQIPKYYDRIKDEFHVEAIVYLTLDSSKLPNKLDWTKEEIFTIDPLLRIIPSYGKNYINLFDDWIAPSIIESKNSESLFILKQYGNLIKHLNTLIMDTIALEKFHTTLKEHDNLKTSLSIRNMLDDIPEYLAIKLENRYSNICAPFEKIWRYQKRDTVFEGFRFNNSYFKMDIWCSELGYKVHFWNPNENEYDIKLNLNFINSLSDFHYDNGKINNIFQMYSFFEEEKLYKFIDQLLLEIRQLKNIPQ